MSDAARTPGDTRSEMSTVTYETDERQKFIFFTHHGVEWVRFINFYGDECTTSLKAFRKIMRDEQKRREIEAAKEKP